jgi:hypothetical protein
MTAPLELAFEAAADEVLEEDAEDDPVAEPEVAEAEPVEEDPDAVLEPVAVPLVSVEPDPEAAATLAEGSGAVAVILLRVEEVIP